MYLLIDFINSEGTIAYTERPDKIKKNIELIEPIKRQIEQQKKANKDTMIIVTDLGRWILIFQSNIKDDENTMMQFLDFRTDIDAFAKNKIYKTNIIQNIKTIQNQYGIDYNSIDIVELTYAEPYENVVKLNFFICTQDDIILSKAKELGILPMIETLKEKDKTKIAFADEKIKVSEKTITNIFVFVNFGQHNKDPKDNGFTYLKIFDFANNYNLINDLQKTVEHLTGGQIDNAFFMERFSLKDYN